MAEGTLGKTELIKHLYEHNKSKFDQVFVINPTSFNDFWPRLVGKERVQTDYDEEWVERLLEKMKEANEGKDKNSPDFKRVLLILDDVMAVVKGHNLKTLNRMAYAGRHYGVSVLLSQQWYTSVSPGQRQAADLLFYGKANKASNELLESESNLDLTAEDFRKMVRECTDNYSFLVIDQTAKDTSDLNKVYGRYKVPL